MRTFTTLPLAGAIALLVVAAGCAAPKRTIRIPESVVANPKNKDGRDRSAAIQPYVIKVSDGKRAYQIEIPVAAATGAFSTAVPLDLGDLQAEGVDRPPTEADREIIEAKRQNGEATPKEEPGQPVKAKSYLATLARVNELFKRRQYELALIELTALDRDYPDDQRVLEMKGSLYWKLRRSKQAREAWERVLALNPNNTVVAQALEQLADDGE